MALDRIISRILHEIGAPDLPQKLSALSQSDFNSLLLELFRTRTAKFEPGDLLRYYKTTRYALPSGLNPAAYRGFEAMLLGAAEEQGIRGILLSPAALLGSCSVFGCVDQNNVLSAGKGTELLSDPTNMLAVILADQLKRGEVDNRVPVHFCASARVTRGQAFAGRMSYPHFGIFCMVSSGRDTGSYLCEKELLVKQLRFYQRLLKEKFEAPISVVLRKRSGYTDGDGFFARMAELVSAEFQDVPLKLDCDHADNAYYKGINYQIFMHLGDEIINIGDGGFVDWTQKLLGSKKERLLISGIGTDRLLMIKGDA